MLFLGVVGDCLHRLWIEGHDWGEFVGEFWMYCGKHVYGFFDCATISFVKIGCYWMGVSD